MSVDSGFFFRLEPHLLSHGTLPTVLLLHSLVRDGWVPNDEGYIVFIPKGDNDLFDWQSSSPEEEARVWAELELKSASQEVLGLVLTWNEEPIGGEFVVRPDMSLSISLSINRRITEIGLTDVSWYLDRIVPTLQKIGNVHEIRWTQAQ